MPDRIILWVAHGDVEKIPPILKILEENGLEIKHCDDLKAYKKLIPALIEFPDDILITADDDLYYPKNWFKQLKESYLKEPNKIHCHRAHEIGVDKNGNILPYDKWKKTIKSTDKEAFIFPTNGGGTLFPPHSLDIRSTNVTEFITQGLMADDIWFWAMGQLNGAKYVIIKNGYSKRLNRIELAGKVIGLWFVNIMEGGNDKCMDAVIKRFPVLMDKLSCNKNY
ncbi:hypothetical protein AGMMS49579_27120 [Spirochaetia bacterium]|nr:hypothetical protein AGMMS49579_27120 [Spirochaetia bacterium]